MDDSIKRYAAYRADETLKGISEESVGSFGLNDIRTIEYVKYILYREPSMNADDMRDLAQLLEGALYHIEWSLL